MWTIGLLSGVKLTLWQITGKLNGAVITANNAIQTNNKNQERCKFVNKQFNYSMYKNRIFAVLFLPVTEAASEANTKRFSLYSRILKCVQLLQMIK